MKYEELTFTERNEITELFANWLNHYTHEVIIKVMAQRDEIISNESSMNMLRELKIREEKEREDFLFSISSLMDDFETFKEYNPHNHPLTHAGSYRDILRDMYIK